MAAATGIPAWNAAAELEPMPTIRAAEAMASDQDPERHAAQHQNQRRGKAEHISAIEVADQIGDQASGLGLEQQRASKPERARPEGRDKRGKLKNRNQNAVDPAQAECSQKHHEELAAGTTELVGREGRQRAVEQRNARSD